MCCLGNICRSPMAEIVLKNLVQARQDANLWKIESCGTAGYHVGDQPDSRTISTCRKHGLDVTVATPARQLKPADFEHFDVVFVMDDSNLANAKHVQQRAKKQYAKLCKLRAYDDQGTSEDVGDPYYGGVQGFETVYQQVTRSLNNWIARDVDG